MNTTFKVCIGLALSGLLSSPVLAQEAVFSTDQQHADALQRILNPDTCHLQQVSGLNHNFGRAVLSSVVIGRTEVVLLGILKSGRAFAATELGKLAGRGKAGHKHFAALGAFVPDALVVAATAPAFNKIVKLYTKGRPIDQTIAGVSLVQIGALGAGPLLGSLPVYETKKLAKRSSIAVEGGRFVVGVVPASGAAPKAVVMAAMTEDGTIAVSDIGGQRIVHVGGNCYDVAEQTGLFTGPAVALFAE